jgi:small subunit ribosomal protein S5
MTEEKRPKAIIEDANNTQDDESLAATPDDAFVAEPSAETADADGAGGEGGRRPRRGHGERRGRRPRRGHGERARAEFDQKIISIRRVARVMAGGRRFNFSVAMVLGNKNGKVGVGIGKAGDTQLAVDKAMRDAKKNMIVVPLTKDGCLPHDVRAKLASSDVMIMPAPGRGLVAGSSVRNVLELAGVKDVTAKIFSRSKNKLNNARAAVKALKLLRKKN